MCPAVLILSIFLLGRNRWLQKKDTCLDQSGFSTKKLHTGKQKKHEKKKKKKKTKKKKNKKKKKKKKQNKTKTKTKQN